jgi:hypothetical protein
MTHDAHYCTTLLPSRRYFARLAGSTMALFDSGVCFSETSGDDSRLPAFRDLDLAELAGDVPLHRPGFHRTQASSQKPAARRTLPQLNRMSAGACAP